MKIAILAWGSLIWSPRTLKVLGPWDHNGPAIPLEFSRISLDGRLTLVIDETHGTSQTTWSIQSGYEDLNSTISNLQERERMPNPNPVGFLDLNTGRLSDRARNHHPTACNTIAQWASRQQFDAVIWTALGPNFQQRSGKVFSTMAAIDYLRKLEGEKKIDTLAYIRSCLPQIRTPLRDAVDKMFPT